jgi:CheY-like chemotaxis protein
MIKVLCVEDNDDNMFVLHRRLTRAGFEVKVAMNGKDGVEWATTMLPQVIVMDLNLPKLDGTEATRRLKSQPETKHIPIIVMTSHYDEKHRAAALAAGCDAYETKPPDFERLVEMIKAFAGRDPQQP